MVVWQSAEGEPTDIQRLDIWSPHYGLSQPLSHVLASVRVSVLCVYVSEGIYTVEEHLQGEFFYNNISLISHWNREREQERKHGE